LPTNYPRKRRYNFKLNCILETSTTDISKEEQPYGLSENIEVAKRGGKVAKIARKALETETGKTVITSKNAMESNQIIVNLIENIDKKE
jgi:hypothetical protein